MTPRAQTAKAPSQWVSGWHAGPTPGRCSGASTMPSGGVVVCAHPAHQGPVDDEEPAAPEPDLLTPSAFRLSPAEPETQEWFTQRRGGITATDVPKILGLSRYGNALSVWLDKRGELPPEPAGEAAFWGTVLEPVIAQVYSERVGVPVQAVGTLANVDEPWMRASLDRLVLEWGDDDQPPTVAGAVEIKNRNAYVSSTWRKDVPDDVLAQVVWQLLVTGLPWIDIAVLLGGNHLVVHRITLQDDGIADVADLCRREATRVWQHVQDGTPPDVDADGVLLDLLERLYPDRTGQRELDPDTTAQALDLLQRYRHSRNAEKFARTDTRNAQAALVRLLDDADTAIGDDGSELFSYPAITRDGYTVAPTTYRQLKIPRRNP